MPPDLSEESRQIIDVFDRIAPGYDDPALRFFPFCADRMVDRLRPRPGSRVLDVATGTGAVLIAAGQAVGPQGRVIGIDLSEPMLDRAQANVAKAGLTNVDLHVMDAAKLEFRSGYFDHVLCSFGLFFLSDMTAALRGWLRVLKPGGTVWFSSFAASALQPMAELFFRDLEAYGVVVARPPAWERLGEARLCRDQLTAAGAVEPQVSSVQLGYHLADAEQWWAVACNSGFRRFVERLGPGERARFRDTHLNKIEALHGDRGIWMDVQVRLSRGRRA